MRSSSEVGNGVPGLHKMVNLMKEVLDAVHLRGGGSRQWTLPLSKIVKQVELSKRSRLEQSFFLHFIFVHKSTNKIVDILVLKQVAVLR